MLADIIKPIVSGTEKSAWITTGKKLNEYQKQILKGEGWTTNKWTRLLFTEEDPILTDLIKLCRIIGIEHGEVAAAIS